MRTRIGRLVLVALCCATGAARAAQDAARGWGPEQALGAPRRLIVGDNPAAWAPREADAGPQWLEVEFERSVRPLALRLFESFHPGALTRVEGFSRRGARFVLWEGQDPLLGSEAAAVLLLPLDAAREVRGLRLTLATGRVAGWNELDALALHGQDGSLQWAVSARASSTFADGETRSPRGLAIDGGAPLPDFGRTRADGLLAVLARLRATPGPGSERLEELAAQLAHEMLELQRAGPPASASWSGVGFASFGPLRLVQDGARVEGLYGADAGSRIVGELREGRLEFRFEEADSAGQGRFELVDDGRGFEGRWRVDGATEWSEWQGRRRAPRAGPPLRWLCVLESPWQASLEAPEYSFGAMLAAIFARSPGVRVRRRALHGTRDLRRWAGELVYLDEPIVLVIASHASAEGLMTTHDVIAPETVAAALAPIPNLVLVHFSACAAMAGDLPGALLDARPPHDALAGVSGYAVDVDWMASALVEFLYFDLVLNRGLDPARAAREVLESVEFAGAGPARGVVPETDFVFRPAGERDEER